MGLCDGASQRKVGRSFNHSKLTSHENVLEIVDIQAQLNGWIKEFLVEVPTLDAN